MNFLPQQMQRAFGRERVFRLLAAMGFAYFLLCVVWISLMAPTYLSVRLARDTYSEQVASLEQSASSTTNVSAITAHVAQLRAFLPREGVSGYDPLELVKKTFAVIPTGIVIQNWSFARSGDDGILRVMGVGADPNALFMLQKAVRSLPFVKSADYSQSFFTLKSDITFALSLTLK